MTSGPSIGRPRFVTLDDAIGWHEVAIEQYGGAAGIRDIGLLESALAQPRQGFGGHFTHTFPFEMAAAYANHIAKNHPFFDGNKRTALLCAGGFLRMNGWDLVSIGTEAADTIISLVEGRLDKASMALWLEEHCSPRPSLELRDFFQSLTPKVHAEIWNAVRAGSTPEIRATTADAANAVPLIGALIEAGEHFASRGDPQQATVAFSQAQLLVHLFRLAEEMGYEW